MADPNPAASPDPREVCANVCHSRASNWADIGMNERCREAHDCASAIRALPREAFGEPQPSEAVKRLVEAARRCMRTVERESRDEYEALSYALASVEKELGQ